MFSRNHRSRVTVARGSALEMEFKRGRFRLSLLSDPPEVRDPCPCLPLPRLPQFGPPGPPAPPARAEGRRRGGSGTDQRLLT